jgi:hypothetical protein
MRERPVRWKSCPATARLAKRKIPGGRIAGNATALSKNIHSNVRFLFFYVLDDVKLSSPGKTGPTGRHFGGAPTGEFCANSNRHRSCLPPRLPRGTAYSAVRNPFRPFGCMGLFSMFVIFSRMKRHEARKGAQQPKDANAGKVPPGDFFELSPRPRRDWQNGEFWAGKCRKYGEGPSGGFFAAYAAFSHGLRKIGGADRDRTDDLSVANVRVAKFLVCPEHFSRFLKHDLSLFSVDNMGYF